MQGLFSAIKIKVPHTLPAAPDPGICYGGGGLPEGRQCMRTGSGADCQRNLDLDTQRPAKSKEGRLGLAPRDDW